MLNPDLEIFLALRESLRSGKPSWLCTVLQTYGSSPRPPGSMLVVNTDGQQCGSLSGGCIEDDLITKLTHFSPEFENSPSVCQYGLTVEEGERFGLPCGGQLDVMVERLHSDHQLAVDQIIERLKARRCVLRKVDLSDGRWHVIECEGHTGLTVDEDSLQQVLGPELRLLLIGIGALAEKLAEFAAPLGYSVTVCDPRPEKVKAWSDELSTAIQGMPDDVVRSLVKDDSTAVLALSHDPRIDDMGLMEALLSPAYYIGALGSTRTAAKRRQRLEELEIPAAAIDRLHAPVGLSIGAKTPAEIAIAILAELTAIKRKSG